MILLGQSVKLQHKGEPQLAATFQSPNHLCVKIFLIQGKKPSVQAPIDTISLSLKKKIGCHKLTGHTEPEDSLTKNNVLLGLSVVF